MSTEVEKPDADVTVQHEQLAWTIWQRVHVETRGLIGLGTAKPMVMKALAQGLANYERDVIEPVLVRMAAADGSKADPLKELAEYVRTNVYICPHRYVGVTCTPCMGQWIAYNTVRT